MILDERGNIDDASIPVLLLRSENLSNIHEIALLFSLEDSVKVFVTFLEGSSIVSVIGSNIFSYLHENFLFLVCTSFDAQCLIRTGKNPYAGVILNSDEDYSQVFGLIKEICRSLTKLVYLNHMFLIMIVECKIPKFDDAGSASNDVGYISFFFFSIRDQGNFTAAKPTEEQYKYVGAVPADTNGFALVKKIDVC